jgi:Holliday junction DNA helicase RuvB
MPLPSPTNIDDIVGQRRLKAFLPRQMAVVQAEGQAFPDMAILGDSGAGKSTVAQLIATAMGGRYLRIQCGPRMRLAELYSEVQKLDFADVLHLDEAQSAPRPIHEALYDLLDKRKVPFSDGRNYDVFNPVSIAQFTVFVTTNEPGALRPELRNRLLELQLEPYADEDMHELIGRYAKDAAVDLEESAAKQLVMITQQSPRRLNKFMHQGLLGLNAREKLLTLEHVLELMELWNIDKYGLDHNQRRYLEALRSCNGRARLTTIASLSRLHRGEITREIEPHLMRMGLIYRDDRTGFRVLSKGCEVAHA